MTLDLTLARAAGRDAGDLAMRAAGRSAWSAEDWDIAAETTARLLAAGLQVGGLDGATQDAAMGMAARAARGRPKMGPARA